MPSPCAWTGDVATFLNTPQSEILGSLTRFLLERGEPQLMAWDRTLSSLRRELASCMPDAGGFALVLEYDLQRSSGRRPDLIVLENGTVLLVEFKNRVSAEPEDLIQVLDYKRRLEDYHEESQSRHVIPILVPIGMTEVGREDQSVHIVGPAGLGGLIRRLAKGIPGKKVDGTRWIQSPYEPLPGLIEAARLFYEKQPLPRIRTAQSSRIPEVVERITSTVRRTLEKSGRQLVLLTGVPGSGKTLVGLQLVHGRELGAPAVVLSGNGPLVQVLQYSLKSNMFVQDVHSFMRDHHIRPDKVPRERIVIFDEAQRAWDRDQVLYKHEGKLTASEPELLVRIAERSNDGSALVALLGEGQEIHIGEESGVDQWAEAVSCGSGWSVIGPPHLEKCFKKHGIPYQADSLLNLTTSLRSHRASEITLWVGLLLQGALEQAREVASSATAHGFEMICSRHLDPLKEHIRSVYQGEKGRRFGLLASSKFRKLGELGVTPARYPFWYYGPWFEAEPDDPRSGCQLNVAISEFGCQGLELDRPLICWGPDLVWTDQGWHARVRKSPRVRDPRRLRLNAYRVLLTRGRDGFAIWVPPEPSELMDSTYQALVRAGVRPLS